MTTGPRFVLQILRNTCVAVAAFAVSAHGATLPAGFTESLVASGLNTPTAMQFAPDGRLFVCEQNGRLRVIKNGALLSTPFLTVTVSSSGERGLLGVAFDPDFAVNQFVYVYYTATSPHDPQPRQPVHRQRRRRRGRQRGRPARPREPDRHQPQWRRPRVRAGRQALHRGRRERGRRRTPSRSNNRLGKILRLNKDGSIPTDNPFYTTATGDNRAIWALGLRNPFTFAFSPSGTVDVHQRRRPGDVGRDQRRRAPARTTAGRTPKGRPRIRGSSRRATATRMPAAPARSSAARSTGPLTAQFPS